MRTRLRTRRGAATVELAVTLIVLLPTFFYAIFLEDLLFYKLEQYETISSTPWDFMVANYQNSVSADTYQHLSRLKYCDHTSAYDSYDNSYECKDNHHTGTAVTAHQCWIAGTGSSEPDLDADRPGDGNDGAPPPLNDDPADRSGTKAYQVTCTLSKDPYSDARGLGLAVNFMRNFNGSHHRGGLSQCRARLGVINYFLPQRQIIAFGKGERNVTRVKHYRGSVHGNSGDANGENAYIFAAHQFAVFQDPWALNEVENVEGQRGGPLAERVQSVWTMPQLAPAKGFAANFVRQIVMPSGPLSPAVALDTVGDFIGSASVSINPRNSRQAANGSYASGWQDSRQRSMEAEAGIYYWRHTAE